MTRCYECGENVNLITSCCASCKECCIHMVSMGAPMGKNVRKVMEKHRQENGGN